VSVRKLSKQHFLCVLRVLCGSKLISALDINHIIIILAKPVTLSISSIRSIYPMKKTLLFVIPLVLFGAFIAYSFISSPDTTEAQYVAPEVFRNWLSQNKAIVVDVQNYDGYLKMHFPGSLATHAYPVRSPEQKKRVDAVIPAIKKSDKPIVLVCPGGITGAPNARLHLLDQGIPNTRLYILKGGTWGFPWKNMMVSGKQN